MSTHKVKFQVPWRNLGKEDLVFEVVKDDELLGKLKVSKGAVVWKPRKWKYALRLDWDRFDRLIQEQGRKGPF